MDPAKNSMKEIHEAGQDYMKSLENKNKEEPKAKNFKNNFDLTKVNEEEINKKGDTLLLKRQGPKDVDMPLKKLKKKK